MIRMGTKRASGYCLGYCEFLLDCSLSVPPCAADLAELRAHSLVDARALALATVAIVLVRRGVTEPRCRCASDGGPVPSSDRCGCVCL